MKRWWRAAGEGTLSRSIAMLANVNAKRINMKLCVRAGHQHEALSWSAKAIYLSGGGPSGGGLGAGGGLQEKARSAEASADDWMVKHSIMQLCARQAHASQVCIRSGRAAYLSGGGLSGGGLDVGGGLSGGGLEAGGGLQKTA